jgi:hypothetical protein
MLKWIYLVSYKAIELFCKNSTVAYRNGEYFYLHFFQISTAKGGFFITSLATKIFMARAEQTSLF